MNQEHLPENDLQQFALAQPETFPELAAHVHTCVTCAAAVANYRAMFAALSTMEKPVFNFDLEKQVLAQLPVSTTAKRGFPWPLLLLGVIVVAILGITLFVMKSSFKNLFRNVPGPVLYLLVTTALTIVIFQCRELVASYREKMRLLNFY
jgi:anti-sigma factor RsiW